MPIVVKEMDGKKKRKSIWKPGEDVEHDEAQDHDMRTRAMQLTKREAAVEATEGILKCQGRKVHQCQRVSGRLRLVEKVSQGLLRRGTKRRGPNPERQRSAHSPPLRQVFSSVEGSPCRY
jgi:hypothetical protein